MSYPFATPWTVAHQDPLSLGFPNQEYWSGLPFPTAIRIRWSHYNDILIKGLVLAKEKHQRAPFLLLFLSLSPPTTHTPKKNNVRTQQEDSHQYARKTAFIGIKPAGTLVFNFLTSKPVRTYFVTQSMIFCYSSSGWLRQSIQHWCLQI